MAIRIAPDILKEEFRKGCFGLEDINMADVVHDIIQDVLGSVDLALASVIEDESVRESIIFAVEDYVFNHYGDL